MGQPRPVLPPSAADIELTAEEIERVSRPAVEAAIRAEKSRQFGKLREAQYWWDVANPKQAATLALNELKYAYMAAAQTQIHPAYATDHGLKDILHALALYFAGNAGFEALTDADGNSLNYKLGKGLLLMGTKGVGKSSMMRVWGQLNQRQRFGVKSCEAVADTYETDGAEGLLVYKQRHTSGVCFDDLGVEPLISSRFANQKGAMASVLQARYDLFQAGQLEGCATHLTTNLTWNDLGRYGDRVTDRLIEMFNIIDFPANSPSRRR